MPNKLRKIFFVAIPLVAILILIIGLLLKPVNHLTVLADLLLTSGSALIGAYVVLLLERFIIGNPLDLFYEKNELFNDSIQTGLKRYIPNRNDFFFGKEIIKYFDETTNVSLIGISLNFIVQNSELLARINKIPEKGKLTIILCHPDSEILKLRDKEEGWDGTLKERLRSTLVELVKIKEKNPSTVSILLFKGEIHNTMISLDDFLIINNHIFGKKGWEAPVSVLLKGNSKNIKHYDNQFESIFEYGKTNPELLIKVENNETISKLFPHQ